MSLNKLIGVKICWLHPVQSIPTLKSLVDSGWSSTDDNCDVSAVLRARIAIDYRCDCEYLISQSSTKVAERIKWKLEGRVNTRAMWWVHAKYGINKQGNIWKHVKAWLWQKSKIMPDYIHIITNPHGSYTSSVYNRHTLWPFGNIVYQVALGVPGRHRQ